MSLSRTERKEQVETKRLNVSNGFSWFRFWKVNQLS